jgi:hypothetical protein
MKSEHTPGPWRKQITDEGFNIADSTGNWDICTITAQYAPTTEQAEANARLLASAPDLLAALRELLAIGEGGVVLRNETGKPTWSALDAVKSIASEAIAKAEGGAA